MFTVVLVRPQVAGNIGAIARVMANFDMTRLVLVASECDHLSKEAQDRAKHAKRILLRARVEPLTVLDSFDYVIGTTAQIGTEFNIPRSPVMLKDAARSVDKRTNIAIVFGSEGTGLTNDEIALCDYVVKISTSKKYPALNVSHAVAIVLYELFAANKRP